MSAGIAHWSPVRQREDLPAPMQTWRVPTSAHCSWGLIAKTFENQAVIRLEITSPRALEVLLSWGVQVLDGDVGVILEYPDEDSAYQLIRYCTDKRIKAHLYLEGMMISAWGGVEHYLRVFYKYPEFLKPRKRTTGEALYIRSVLKTVELERIWQKNHLAR